MLVVIGSMPMVICNSFHERLANNGKITTFTGVPLFRCPRAQVSLNLENRDLFGRLKSIEFMLKISYSLSMSISIDFSAIRS